MKRIILPLFCLLMALALVACKKPFGQTPYESVSPDDPPTYTDEDLNSEDNEADAPADDQTPDGSQPESDGTADTPADGNQTPATDTNDLPDEGDDDDGANQPGSTKVPVSGGTTAASGKTTGKSQPGGTTRRPGGTTANRDEENDNVADLEWGDLTTTAKPGTPTTAVTPGSTTPGATTTNPPITTTTKPTTTTTIKAGVKVLPKAGDSVHQYLKLGAVTVDTDKLTGSMVVKNVSRGYETEQTKSCLIYTCYDRAGKKLGDVRINIGRINAGQESEAIAFTLPEGTYSMGFKEAQVEFWTDGFH